MLVKQTPDLWLFCYFPPLSSPTVVFPLLAIDFIVHWQSNDSVMTSGRCSDGMDSREGTPAMEKQSGMASTG